MKKQLVFLIIALISSTALFSQAQNDIRARRVIANEQILLRNTRIDSILNDTTGIAGKTKSILTAKAVYDLVVGRSGGGGGSGTVTSVGLSMPSAFSVSGSPVTNSGTISVTGAGTTDQIIRGDGSLATLDTNGIPNFSAKVRSLFSATSPLVYSNGNFSIANAAADGSTKGAASFTANDFNSSSGNISIDYTNGQAASGSTKGFLTSSDWTTFNNKAPATGGTGYIQNQYAGSQAANFYVTGSFRRETSTDIQDYLREVFDATGYYNQWRNGSLEDFQAAIRINPTDIFMGYDRGVILEAGDKTSIFNYINVAELGIKFSPNSTAAAANFWGENSSGYLTKRTASQFRGDLAVVGTGDTASMLSNYVRRQELKDTAAAIRSAITGGFTNPMTTEGDLIIGGASGTPTRLPIGTTNYVLKSNGTTASWQAEAGGITTGQLTDSLNTVWRQTGNNITYGKYIGTNNDYDLRFFTNGTERGSFDSASGDFTISNHMNMTATKQIKWGNQSNIWGGDANGTFLNYGSNNVAVGAGNASISVLGSSFTLESGTHATLTVPLYGMQSGIFNDNGGDYDFRVEGDTDPNLLFLDASADEVRIGTSTDAGAYKFQVNGNSYFSGGSTTIHDNDIYINTSTLTERNLRFTYAGTTFGRAYLDFSGAFTFRSEPYSIRFKSDVGNLLFDAPGLINFTGSAELNVVSTTPSGLSPKFGFKYSSNQFNSQWIDWDVAQYKNVTLTGSSYSAFIGGELSGITMYHAGITVNENGSDYDFRIESDGNSNMFFVDAGNNRVGIGTGTPDNTLHVAGTVKIVDGTQGLNKVLTSDANGVASWQTPPAGLTLDEGSYTPTITNTTNIGSSTATTTYWFRVGDRIYVFGQVEIDATSAGTLSEMGLTLPISSTISNESDLAGTAVHEDGTPIRIMGDTVNGRAKFKFTPNTATANKYSFHFSYLYVAP